MILIYKNNDHFKKVLRNDYEYSCTNFIIKQLVYNCIFETIIKFHYLSMFLWKTFNLWSVILMSKGLDVFPI